MHDVTNLRDQNSHPFRAAKPSAIRNYASLPKYLSQRRTLAIRKSHFFSRAANLLRDQKQCFASEVFFSATNPSRSEIASFFLARRTPFANGNYASLPKYFSQRRTLRDQKSHLFFGAANPLRERKLCFASEVFFSATNPSRSENRTFLRAVNPFAIRSNASLPKYLSQDGLNAALTFSATNLRDQKIAFFFARRTLRERELCFASEVFFSATN